MTQYSGHPHVPSAVRAAALRARERTRQRATSEHRRMVRGGRPDRRHDHGSTTTETGSADSPTPATVVTQAQAAGLTIELQRRRDVGRVVVSGELDLATGPQLRAAVTGLVARGADHVVVDLRTLTFMDATGVGLLLSLAERARREGWQLTLTEARGQVGRLLVVTETHDRLPVAPGP